jgi:hypothetical protein
MLAGGFSRNFSRQNAALGANGGQKRCHRDAKAAGTGAATRDYDLKPQNHSHCEGCHGEM